MSSFLYRFVFLGCGSSWTTVERCQDRETDFGMPPCNIKKHHKIKSLTMIDSSSNPCRDGLHALPSPGSPWSQWGTHPLLNVELSEIQNNKKRKHVWNDEYQWLVSNYQNWDGVPKSVSGSWHRSTVVQPLPHPRKKTVEKTWYCQIVFLLIWKNEHSGRTRHGIAYFLDTL